MISVAKKIIIIQADFFSFSYPISPWHSLHIVPSRPFCLSYFSWDIIIQTKVGLYFVHVQMGDRHEGGCPQDTPVFAVWQQRTKGPPPGNFRVCCVTRVHQTSPSGRVRAKGPNISVFVVWQAQAFVWMISVTVNNNNKRNKTDTQTEHFFNIVIGKGSTWSCRVNTDPGPVWPEWSESKLRLGWRRT